MPGSVHFLPGVKFAIGFCSAVADAPRLATDGVALRVLAESLILGKKSGVGHFKARRSLDENPAAQHFALTPRSDDICCATTCHVPPSVLAGLPRLRPHSFGHCRGRGAGQVDRVERVGRAESSEVCMRVMRTNASLFGLLAAWVLALAMMAPTVSHWVQMQRGGDWVEVCTAQGPQRLQLGGDSQAPVVPKLFMVDCGFCTLQAEQTPIVVVSLLLALLLSDEGQADPWPELDAVLTPAVWQPQQSRAPPALA